MLKSTPRSKECRAQKRERLLKELKEAQEEGALLSRRLAFVKGTEALTKTTHQTAKLSGEILATVVGGPSATAAFHAGVGTLTNVGQQIVSTTMGDKNAKEALVDGGGRLIEDSVGAAVMFAGGKAGNKVLEKLSNPLKDTVKEKLLSYAFAHQAAGAAQSTVQNLGAAGKKIANGERITEKDAVDFSANYFSNAVGSLAGAGTPQKIVSRSVKSTVKKAISHVVSHIVAEGTNLIRLGTSDIPTELEKTSLPKVTS